MIDQLKELQINFNDRIKNSSSRESVEELKKEFMGKNSPLNAILQQLRNVDAQTRQEAGKLANEIKNQILGEINALQDKFDQEDLKSQLSSEKMDVSLPGLEMSFGSKHPLNLVIEELSEIFSELGFEMVDGTEFEEDEYNFQRLNLPEGHPARDMQDTFYVNEKEVLRTHCTNMSSRVLSELALLSGDVKQHGSVSFGNVYRRDVDDATHSHQFMQIDAFLIGPKISFANLKWILQYLCKRLFGDNVNIRMRPSYFPFTEPSAEVDLSCFKCCGSGCKLCKNSGWIEILGSGMFNENVLKLNGINPQKNTALAFGVGVERIAMLKYGISNIRDFYENDIRFLNQFHFFGN
ncbi:phenylalanine--tRNA ligase subunit alpha [Spiroplasma alleghenense]|uniref:Phenylalanine--tRNA ligase alpha subunit n=1 Tax=Spiroplasma alleghenense TaxID=216931 RepID=A0A345Z3X2_9MOLU|nr:phenylalanine--tRNA ligase subunit alpha [Spiroplasma alleghenense]AXK51301.1 phenylalanyl-tRNA synthetase subunit alpha [Spiroplasma alleghenense]